VEAQLEGTVGGYWGLFDSVKREVKYPPGVAISNYPAWKWQLGCGMGLSFLTFGAAWLTLRRRPWTPRLASWIAVGVAATTAGILLGIATDKMLLRELRHRRGSSGGRCWRGRWRRRCCVRMR